MPWPVRQSGRRVGPGSKTNNLMKEGSYQEEAGLFFVEAEDGIRDVAVTGVHTCALPILPEGLRRPFPQRRRRGRVARHSGDRGGVSVATRRRGGNASYLPCCGVC